MSPAEHHLIELLAGVVAALRAVGWDNEADRVEMLDGDIETALDLLGKLGPLLAHAHAKARLFTARAPPSIKGDAVKYEADLFAARCWVAVARAAARRVARGEPLLVS